MSSQKASSSHQDTSLAKRIGQLAVAIAVPLLVGVIGATVGAPGAWYAGLTKPPLNPPNWVFGPAWTTLYILMGVAAYLVWRHGLQDARVRWALTAFVVQLVFNGLWSLVFFGLEMPLLALVDIILLIIAIVITMQLFLPLSRLATLLLAPYLAWVIFATYLNAGIFLLN
jgi:tryptophan-rich sensory protein